jgi:predicted flap endonuclease-1-like 5' DNA nuclease
VYDVSWPDTPEVQLIKSARPRPVPVMAEAAQAQAPATTVETAPVETPVAPDDLEKLEGIGPGISRLLQEAGITTFAQLAKTEVSQLREILQKAGSRFQMSDPGSWPEQAELAAAGKWAELETLQGQLAGGRRREEER